MPQEHVIPTDPANDSVFRGGGFKEMRGWERSSGHAKAQLQLEADGETEADENTFGEGAELNLVQDCWGTKWTLCN